MPDETTKKEASMTLASIRAEIAVEVENLSGLYTEKESVNSERKAFEAEKAAFMLNKEAHDAQMALERAEIAREREQMREEKTWHEKAVTELKTQNKLALKDLAWVNDKVLKGNDEILEAKKELEILVADIVIKKQEKEKFLSLENEFSFLEKNKIAVLTETELAKANADAYLKNHQQALEEVLSKRDSALEETTQAEYLLKDYTSELFIKREDFKVYVDRLETHCKREFPDLKIKL